MRVIDGHVHVFAKVSQQYPRETSELAPPEREAPVELLLQVMESNGVEQAVLTQMGGYGEANHRYLTDCLHLYPDRFVGIGLVNPHSENPVGELDELVEATGVRGIRLFYLGEPGSTEGKQLLTYPLWQRAAELGLVLWLYPQPDQVTLLELLVREFPTVPVVLNHMGMCPSNFSVDRWGRPRIQTEIPPPHFPIVLGLARYSNVYVKISGEYAFSNEPYPYQDLQPIVHALYEAYGASRLLWATDFPWILEEPGYAPLTQLIARHLPNLSTEERGQIMGGTAAQLLRFPEVNLK